MADEQPTPRKAVKDTFAIERIGDLEVRRQVVAGSEVPAHYEVDDESALGDPVESRRGRGYSDEGTHRVSMEPEGGGVRTTKTHDPGQVERVHGSDADAPHAEGEEELAENTLLGARKPPEGESSKERAKRADRENKEGRENEGDETPASRIAKRLKSGEKPAAGRRRAESAKADDAKTEGDKPKE